MSNFLERVNFLSITAATMITMSTIKMLTTTMMAIAHTGKLLPPVDGVTGARSYTERDYDNILKSKSYASISILLLQY